MLRVKEKMLKLNFLKQVILLNKKLIGRKIIVKVKETDDSIEINLDKNRPSNFESNEIYDRVRVSRHEETLQVQEEGGKRKIHTS